VATLTRITVYPIKSLDGVDLPSVRILPGGALENDRRFALRDAARVYVNAKRTPAIHAVAARFAADLSAVTLGLRDGSRAATFPLTGGRDALRPMEEWFSAHFGFRVFVAEDADLGFPDDTDAPGPTVVSEATWSAVAGWYPGLSADETRRRFRANLEVGGADVPAFWEDRLVPADEDGAVPLRIGDPNGATGATLLGVNPCRRCPVPTRHPDTGEARPRFVDTFIARRRETLPPWAPAGRFANSYRLTVNTRPADRSGGVLRVGDEVRVG
jgi:uncharacterized protein YcbX